MLSLTRSATDTDAFVDVLLDDSTYQTGKYTFEISLKSSETFDSRGSIFNIFEYQFLKFAADGSTTNHAGTAIGRLPADRFMKISLTVDSETGAYQILFDDVQADAGTVAFREISTFRPIHFFASGNSALYLDYIKAYKS